jgi:hypothetical protein
MLSHLLVRDYLLSPENRANLILEGYHIHEAITKFELADTCFQYIESED